MTQRTEDIDRYILKTPRSEDDELVEATAKAIRAVQLDCGKANAQSCVDAAKVVIPIIRRHERKKIARDFIAFLDAAKPGGSYGYRTTRADIKVFFHDKYGIEVKP